MECLGGHWVVECPAAAASAAPPAPSPQCHPQEQEWRLEHVCPAQLMGTAVARGPLRPCPDVAAKGRNKTPCGILHPFMLEKCHGWSWGDCCLLTTETLLPSREWLEVLPSLRLVFSGKIVKPLSSAPHHLPGCFTNSALQWLPPPSQESLGSPTGPQVITSL